MEGTLAPSLPLTGPPANAVAFAKASQGARATSLFFSVLANELGSILMEDPLH